MAPEFVQSKVSWFCRQLAIRRFRLPVTVALRTGERFHLGDDPISDIVIKETFGVYKDLYFPRDVPSDSDGWILDVGAHHGVFTVGALSYYNCARAIAVEPDPEALKYLRRNLRLNGLEDRVDVVEAAVGSVSSTGTLLKASEGSWAHRLTSGKDSGPTIQVRTLTFDDIVAQRRLDIVKTNCEGGEYALIPQLLASGQRPPLIVLLAHTGEDNPESLVSLLQASGYDCVPTHSTSKYPRMVCRLRERRASPYHNSRV